MENLLSLAYDNLSSWDGPKQRKGLRQVEGLLANICLSRQQSSSSGSSSNQKDRRASVAKDPGKGSYDDDGEGTENGGVDEEYDDDDDAEEEQTPSQTTTATTKKLSQLADDPAFCEFFKLQEGFEWNVALRLVNTLDRLISRSGDGSKDLLILNALDLIQGALFLHPPSKLLFARELEMGLLFDLLDPDFCPAIQSAAMLTLTIALLDTPQNTRTFERADGLLTVTSLAKSRGSSREVKKRSMEFLYFYLMPETPSIPTAAAARRDSVPGMLQRSPSKLAKAFAFVGHGPDGKAGRGGGAGGAGGDGESGETRSQEEKQALLARHLGESGVRDLVKDLGQCYAPFEGVLG
ncbi:cell division control 14, SIN component [Xylariomycetidae sp. FL2044]|nr:cell division control 14, SIN component [Xylariomycetidae sp. FL2044]